MNWKNIKTFMIILLVLVNIFLAAMLLGQSGLKVYDSEAINNITELLLDGGIIADESFLSMTVESSKVYACDIGDGYTDKIAKMLMGEYEEVFATPDGAEFFGKDSHMKISEDLRIEYSANGFEAAAATETLSSSETEELEKMLSTLLGGGTELIRSAKNGSLIYAEAVQTLGELDISNHTVKCWFEEDKLVYLEGMWCFLSIEESFSAHTLDSVNILFIEKNELSDARNGDGSIPDMLTLENMTECYCSHLSANGTRLYFMPSWHIEWAEDGAEDSFYNAVNGEKTVFTD